MEKVVRRVCESRWGALLIGAVIGSCVTQLFTAAPRVPHTTELRTSSSRSPAWLLRTQESQSKSVWSEYIKDPQSKEEKLPRKVLLDCGANVASTVQLFRETYPDGQDFIIHSFEIDERLAPFFAPYPNHVLHCPTGVSNKDVEILETCFSCESWTLFELGNMTAYSESAWSPDKGKNNRRDMQWGGGSLFAFDDEKADTETGGRRKLSHHRTVPTVDLSRWIQENTAVEDYVIFKLDVEGAEYDILKKMLEDGTFKWVDNCSAPPSGAPRLALTVLVGMNVKAAHKLVETIAAHSSRMPVTLFLYGDFVETFPELVTEWAKTFTIGMRENQPFPLGHFTMQASPWIGTGLVSAIQRLSEVDIQTAYYLPENVTETVINEAKSRGLRIIQPTARFPPTDDEWLLSVENYYKYRDVERTPKALRVITQQLDNKGGIVSLDSDHPDSYMISVFLMDYLVEKSGYNLVSIVGCLE
uniref:Methyltransferase FkbM domain-containing protein n=1 Tax=Branchiostoma floridae TaxID=7739 RepID=C3Y9X0_BRAFL|eukprot:XP_002606869.1 hypothetical protein BRAFLDRAFT_126345 [Branchiostoma floridae]